VGALVGVLVGTLVGDLVGPMEAVGTDPWVGDRVVRIGLLETTKGIAIVGLAVVGASIEEPPITANCPPQLSVE